MCESRGERQTVRSVEVLFFVLRYIVSQQRAIKVLKVLIYCHRNTLLPKYYPLKIQFFLNIIIEAGKKWKDMPSILDTKGHSVSTRK
mgnify:CR=1 FL=1